MSVPLSLLIVLHILSSGNVLLSSGLPSYREEPEVCQTSECHKAAQALLDSMNVSVDPCVDFYQYTCGGWIEKNPIPEEKSSYSTFYILFDQLLDSLGEILKTATEENHAKPVLDAALFFQGCMDEGARETQGLDPLRNVMRELGDWPMANPDWTDAGYQWQTKLASAARILGVSPIVGVYVDADSNYTSRHIIYLDQPYFGIGRNQLINLTSSERTMAIVTAYRNYIISTAKLLNPSADETQLGNDADEMIQFESDIAKFSKPREERRDPKQWYNKMTVAELQSITENTYFNWRDFLNVLLQDFPAVADDTEVIVREPEYLKNAIKVVHNYNSRVLANYIGWRVLKKVGQHTTKKFREIEFNFQKVETGVEKAEKLERVCTENTIGLLGYAVGRLYVDRYFSEQAKQDVDQLVEDLRSTYESTLRSNPWMDENTKNKAIEKLRSMISMMGYPPWIRDDNALNKYYQSVQNVKQDEYFSSLVRVTRAVTAFELKKWNKPTDRRHEWVTTPAVVNAFYNPSANTITFPAGILNLPFYKYGRSLGLNFGGIGSVIGHELSHGFDDEGGQSDSEGNLVNWWSKETKAEFDKKANCFKQQYSSQVEPTTGMNLNGNITVGENIADNGAVRNSFMAYRRRASQSPDIKLPGISATPEQLFFIGYASVWCSSERKESLEWLIQYDPHTPNEFRALLPLMNSREFARAFNCPSGSRMNPEAKCQLW